MNRKKIAFLVLVNVIIFHGCILAQIKEADKIVPLSDYTHSFVSIDSPSIALINAKIIDGIGSPVKELQTVLIENGKIINIGASIKINIPNDYHTIDLSGKTLIPGIIGTHNHMRLPQRAMLHTSPKLYLASGVTTIQTCGTGNPLEELAIAKSIQNGLQPGPEIVNSGPYFTGPNGKSNFIRFIDERKVRDTIRYWAEQGVKWFKVYRNIRPQDLKVIIDEAHKNNAKVTGHLCATTYQEAAELGIDAIEHGFIHSYDHAEGKELDLCSGSRDFRSSLTIDNNEVRHVQQILIKNNVALCSTLSIFEVQARGEADERDIEVMSPFHQEAYNLRRKRKQEQGKDWYFKEDWLLKSMKYDRQFYNHGGLLVAGLDPGLHNMPGYGDQKNYELFIEAGFKSEEAIQVMTNNGAKLLEKMNVGSIEIGKIANLVVLDGDLEKEPKVIRMVNTVFKQGIGYDPMKLIEAVKGNVGSLNDDLMTYLGQKEPSNIPELFAKNLISKPRRHEFGCVFSKNGREIFFAVDSEGKSEIHFSQLKDGVWSLPKALLIDSIYSYNDPMLSPDEQRLYFISDQPLDRMESRKDMDIWYIERIDERWSSPINADKKINSEKNEYYISFSENGEMYFSSNIDSNKGEEHNFDIYSSKRVKGKFEIPTKLDENINTNAYEADVFIAPDESYIIFCAIREGGYGQGDLYISFNDNNGNWSPSKNMGKTINTENHELCPFVTKDGKYLFFTSNKDIYWVSTELIEEYKANAW